MSQVLLSSTFSLSSLDFLAVGDSHLLCLPQGSAFGIIISPSSPEHRKAMSQ